MPATMPGSHFTQPTFIIPFFVLAYAISWSFWGLAIFFGDSPLGAVGYYAGGFGPFLAALIATRLSGGSIWTWFKSLWRWRVGLGFWLFVLGFPIFLALAATALHGALGGAVTLNDLGARIALWGPTLLMVTLIGGGNEELGWRGYALPALQESLSSVWATLVLGVLWAFWHLPLLAIGGEGLGAFLMSWQDLAIAGVTIISITTHAFWYTWLYNRTGSVLLCILLHGGYNAANARLILVPEDSLHGGDERQLLFVMTGLLVISVLLLLVATGGRLGKVPHG